MSASRESSPLSDIPDDFDEDMKETSKPRPGKETEAPRNQAPELEEKKPDLTKEVKLNGQAARISPIPTAIGPDKDDSVKKAGDRLPSIPAAESDKGNSTPLQALEGLGSGTNEISENALNERSPKTDQKSAAEEEVLPPSTPPKDLDVRKIEVAMTLQKKEDSLLAPEVADEETSLRPVTPKAPEDNQNESTAELTKGGERETSTVTPSNVRSVRKRQAPAKLEDEAPVPAKKPKKAAATPATRRNAIRGNWGSDHLLQSAKSKLIKVPLKELLLDEMAWTALDPDQQAQLFSLLPESSPTDGGGSDAVVPDVIRNALQNNSALKADLRMFQEDLEAGRLEPKWQKEAAEAMEQRAKGDFDAWKYSQIEEFWGQKQKLKHGVIAGDMSKIKLESLVAANCFRVGDVWSYSKRFRRIGRGKNQVLVEKEATITQIAGGSQLCFRYPPGQYKISSAANGEDITTPPMNSPQALFMAILKEDGRITDPPNGNAWKEFRVYRNNQDIGSPWEIRENYYVRRQE